MNHRLKTHPAPFEMVLSGEKPFEIRKDDRGYHVGDTLTLCEYDPFENRFTGREHGVIVTCIISAPAWIPDSDFDYVIMGIKEGNPNE